jgi:serine/threonine protein phosphatase PrpC
VVAEMDLARIAQSNPPAEACLLLVGMALGRGGPDNITVSVLRISA